MGGESPEWWLSWAQAWLDHQRRRGRAPASIDTWGWAIRDFGAYLVEQHVSPDTIDKTTLRAWQDRLSIRVAPSSQQVAIGAIRQALKFADREGLSARPGLSVWLEGPRVNPPLPRPLEPEHLAAVLRWYGGEPPLLRGARLQGAGGIPAHREWYRDRALFLFMLTTGCRISEALQVDRDDVGAGALVVLQKGGREHRLVPSTTARQWVTEYLRRRGRDGEPALWVRTGPSGRVARLTYEHANDTWRELAYRLGIPRFTSRTLRHTAATEILDHGGNEVDVQQQLGHASLATVHRYAKVRERRRQALADRLDDLVPEHRPAVLKPINRRRRRRA